MDKFGIFKLLNSFYDFYSKNKPNLAENKSEEIKAKPPEKQAPPMPLQQSMIATINSHDELVKRVMQNNKKQHPQK